MKSTSVVKHACKSSSTHIVWYARGGSFQQKLSYKCSVGFSATPFEMAARSAILALFLLAERLQIGGKSFERSSEIFLANKTDSQRNTKRNRFRSALLLMKPARTGPPTAGFFLRGGGNPGSNPGQYLGKPHPGDCYISALPCFGFSLGVWVLGIFFLRERKVSEF